MARMFPGEAEFVSELTGLPGGESLQRFDRSNGLDTAPYKTYLLPMSGVQHWHYEIILFATRF